MTSQGIEDLQGVEQRLVRLVLSEDGDGNRGALVGMGHRLVDEQQRSGEVGQLQSLGEAIMQLPFKGDVRGPGDSPVDDWNQDVSGLQNANPQNLSVEDRWEDLRCAGGRYQASRAEERPPDSPGTETSGWDEESKPNNESKQFCWNSQSRPDAQVSRPESSLSESPSERLSHSVPLSEYVDVGFYDQVMPILGQKVTVRVAYTAQGVEDWIQQCSPQERSFGIDIEWRPNWRRGDDNYAALCQLSSANRCLIVQLLYLDYIPEALKTLLADPEVKMAGVGVKGDIEKLREDYGLKCRGEVDLGSYAADILQKKELKSAGLATLCSSILGIPFKKNKRLTLSNWALQGLSYQQIDYAATDAWVAYSLLDSLNAKREEVLCANASGDQKSDDGEAELVETRKEGEADEAVASPILPEEVCAAVNC